MLTTGNGFQVEKRPEVGTSGATEEFGLMSSHWTAGSPTLNKSYIIYFEMTSIDRDLRLKMVKH